MFLFHFIGSSSRFNARREYARPASHVVQDPLFGAMSPRVERGRTPNPRKPPLPPPINHHPPSPPQLLKLSVQLLFGGCGLPVAATTTHPPFQLPESSMRTRFRRLRTFYGRRLHTSPPKSSVLHSFRWWYASLAAPTNHPHNRSQLPKTSAPAGCISLAAATND